MIARTQTLTKFKKLLANPDSFKLGEAVDAIEMLYRNSPCTECDDDSDGMVFMSGVFDDYPDNLQIVLTRNYEWFSQLTVVMRFACGWRSRVTPKANVICSGRDESDNFFRDTRRTWTYRVYRNLQPVSCSIQYEDCDDKPASFYEHFFKTMAPVFSEA